jgi:hypothetical protein
VKFFADSLSQGLKRGQMVCGDVFRIARTASGTFFTVCDGVGSGVYANISALTCASRLLELFRSGVGVQAASEMVAVSMHRARTEDIPFSAFTAACVFPDGRFQCYAYEAPPPILIREGAPEALPLRRYGAGRETIGEASGSLSLGDALTVFSDGVSEAGLGRGYSYGIGAAEAAAFMGRCLAEGERLSGLPARIIDMCRKASGGRHADDATAALVECRAASELTLLTGPPSRRSLDAACVRDFMAQPGLKAACGSTTADILSRELGAPARMLVAEEAFGQPPEYLVEGVDLVTEGAITLNQAYNILDAPLDRLGGNTPAERLCLMLRKADVIRLMIGGAPNIAHEDLMFRQIGVRVRQSAVALISEALRNMGKLVTVKRY